MEAVEFARWKRGTAERNEEGVDVAVFLMDKMSSLRQYEQSITYLTEMILL